MSNTLEKSKIRTFVCLWLSKDLAIEPTVESN